MVKRKMPPHIVLPNGQWRFVKRGHKSSSHRARGGFVRKKGGHRRGMGMGGLMSFVKPVLAGTIAGIVAPRIPILNSLPFNGAIAGTAATYLVGGRGIPKLAVGAASGQFLAPVANRALGSAMGSPTGTLF